MTMTDDSGYTVWNRGGVKPLPTLPPGVNERQFWLEQREAFLCQIDSIERMLGITPRTAEVRAQMRQSRRVDGAS